MRLFEMSLAVDGACAALGQPHDEPPKAKHHGGVRITFVASTTRRVSVTDSSGSSAETDSSDDETAGDDE